MGERTDAVSGNDRTDDLRRDIERTQREMSRTIDEIQHRLSPNYMMQRTKESMKEAGVNASRGFIDKVRENPIPAAMVGVGLFLLMRDSDSRDSRYEVDFIPERSGWDNAGTRSSMSHAADSAREKVGEAVSSAREATSDAFESVAGRARHLGQQTRYGMSRARMQSRDVLQDNPLIAGLAAIAAGAILGALLPETEKENKLLGDTRDRLADKARDAARDGLDRAREVASAATHAATDAAKSEVKAQTRTQSQGERNDVGTSIGVGGNPTGV